VIPLHILGDKKINLKSPVIYDVAMGFLERQSVPLYQTLQLLSALMKRNITVIMYIIYSVAPQLFLNDYFCFTLEKKIIIVLHNPNHMKRGELLLISPWRMLLVNSHFYCSHFDTQL
jgi:hypothetical protein